MVSLSGMQSGLNPNPMLGRDPGKGLTGMDRDAYVAITNTLRTYGLDSLAQDVLKFIQEGYAADTINVLLQQTEAYKKRFNANEVRRQKGLPVLSPGEYLAVEAGYRQVMQAAGLPPSFYDQPDDFERWIGSDVAPAEVQRRSQTAQQLIENIDPNVRKEMERYYTRGDLVAYALDPQRTTEVLERQARAAAVGAAAIGQGTGVDRELAERIGSTGIDDQGMRAGFGQAVVAGRDGSKLSGIYGGDYGEDDAIDEVFFADANATEKRKRLASQERGSFSGTSGVGEKSLGRPTGGRI